MSSNDQRHNPRALPFTISLDSLAVYSFLSQKVVGSDSMPELKHIMKAATPAQY